MSGIKIRMVLMMFVVIAFTLTGCTSQKMQDGFYTAECAEYSHGWKEYICILVKDGKIVSLEYNAKDPSGYIKAWDNEYMRNMGAVTGTYPNTYTRQLGAQLVEDQNADSIDVVTGATHSSHTFVGLAQAAIDQAKRGDTSKIIVTTE